MKRLNLNQNFELGFEVWIEHPRDGYSFCVAAFTYWQECLDYKEYCLKRGMPCIIRTLQPTHADGTSAWRSERREPDTK